MSTATLTTPAAFAGAPAKTATASTAAPRKGFWMRAFEAYMNGRMRQAEREIARLRHLIPQDELRAAGFRVGVNESDRLPFGR